MNKIIGMRGLQLIAGSALMLVASLSHAQWVWVDAKGVKQFSDRSPPPNIPQKSILKAPRGVPTAADPEPVAEAAAAGTASSAPAKMTLADREADYKKRQADKALADKKSANDSAIAAHKKASCDLARAQKAQLDSGIRLRTGADGSFMDDAQREKENAAVKKNLSDC